jgi:ABC-type multidrug transport system fused ATPase/permease subunit
VRGLPGLNGISRNKVGHRVAFVSVAVLLLYTVALLPFAIGGVFADLLDPPANRIHSVLAPHDPNPSHLRIHLDIVTLDESSRTASVRVSGHQVCPGTCTESYQILLVSAPSKVSDAEGLPPSAAVRFPAGSQEISETVTLPVHGLFIRYPFDTYGLRLGIVLQQVLPNGTVQPFNQTDAADRLFLTFQSEVQRSETKGPDPLDPSEIRTLGGTYPFVVAKEIVFERPIYLKILTLLLVLLVTAAAAFAVFMRPLSDLVTSVGALVLGVWGVRSILVGTTAVPGQTAVDLSLSVVMLFLLMAITVRSFMFLDERSGLNIFRRVRSHVDYRPAHGPVMPPNGTTNVPVVDRRSDPASRS